MTKNYEKKITRRSILKLFFLILVSITATFSFLKRKVLILLSNKLRHNINPYQLDRAATKGSLLTDQMNNILGLAVVLIPSENGILTVRKWTMENVNGLCKYESGAKKLYEEASKLLDQKAYSRFHVNKFFTLDDDKKYIIVSNIMPPIIKTRRHWRHLYNLIFRYEETRMAELVVNDILINFYGSEQSLNYLQEG